MASVVVTEPINCHADQRHTWASASNPTTNNSNLDESVPEFQCVPLVGRIIELILLRLLSPTGP